MLALGLTLVATLALEPPPVRGPARSLRLEGGVMLGTDLYARGSPNQSQYAPQTRLRLAFGLPKLGFVAHFGIGFPVAPRQSIAERNTGILVEQGLGIRTMPVQRKRLRFGLWALFGWEWLQRRTELDVEGETFRQRTRVNHLYPELGFEWGFPLPAVRLAKRDVGLAITLTHAVAFVFPVGLARELVDPDGTVTSAHYRAAELGVVGPAGGIVADVFLGIVVTWDVQRPGHASSQPTAW